MKKRFLLILLIVFALYVVEESCTKIDISSPHRILSQSEISEQFFSVPANAPIAVRRTAEDMKKRNSKNEFIGKFIKDNGNPRWDKAIISFTRKRPQIAYGKDGDSTKVDTVVVIPVVKTDSFYVSGFIKARLNGHVNLAFYRGNDYSFYSFNEVPSDSINADKAALQIIYLNYKVFGYTAYEVSDNRLMSTDALRDTTKAHRIFEITSVQEPPASFVGGHESNLLLEIQMCTDVYVVMNGSCSGGRQGFTGRLTDAQNNIIIPGHHCLIYTGQSCYSIWVDDGGGDGSDGASTGSEPGGDTGGGGGGTPTFPCASSQGKSIGIANPCGGSNNPPPIIPIIPVRKNPCEALAELMGSPYFRSYYTALKDSLSLNHEVGFAFLNPLTPNTEYSYYPGIPNELGIDMNLDNAVDGVAHCHNNYPRRLSVPSFDDFAKMAGWFVNGLIRDTTHFTMGLVTDSTSYIMMIDDPVKYKHFITTQLSTDELVQNFNFTYYQLYRISEQNTAAINERRFLTAMSKYDAGLKIFKGTADLSQFNPVKVSQDGLSVVADPCN